MKLMWFHLMPYTELPDDFREKHPSVWVDIHSSLFDPRRAHHMYNDFMDELEFAAECGFDAVCVNEHHSNGYGLMPSPNLIASSLARRTTDTALCVMGNSLALYNPPTRVAEEFAMIDVISGGRLIAGFPVGTPMDTCFAYGQNPSMLRERYLEAHDLVMRAWTEPDTFAFNGRFNQQRYVNIWPRPMQKPHPPVWIPGGGSVETWQWCAKMDYVYAYLSYFGYKDGRATMQGFWDEMKRLGKDRNPYRAGFLQFVGVAESREEAMRALRRAGRVFLWPLPARRPEMGDAARLHHRGDAARRRPGPDRPRRQPQRPPGGAGDDRHGGHRRSRLCDRRLARRGRRTADRGRDRPQCRPPDDAAAVRQHGQGAWRPVQHASSLPSRCMPRLKQPVLRMGGPLVAAADGGAPNAPSCSRRCSPPNRPNGITGLPANRVGAAPGPLRDTPHHLPARQSSRHKVNYYSIKPFSVSLRVQWSNKHINKPALITRDAIRSKSLS